MRPATLTTTTLDDGVPHTLSYPAGHSGKLKYANPRDLPSFPSMGLTHNGAAASAAASLGWANQKSIDLWRPDPSSSASAAAALAKDFKMAQTWTPEPSAAGSQAALLAAESAGRTMSASHANTGLAQMTSGWGNSAANLAFAAGRSPSATNLDRAATPADLSRQPSLRAAKGAFAAKTQQRPRAQSSPLSPSPIVPEPATSMSHAALSAATIAHRPSMRSPAANSTASTEQAGAVPYTTLGKLMFTSNPPVNVETEEKKRQDVLHASAVAMAKRMYNNQQQVIDTTKANRLARSSSFTRHNGASPVNSPDDEPVVPMQFNNLQEAAYRLAQERLAKLSDEHQRNRGYHEYYGSNASGGGSKLGTLQRKLTRRRSSSDTDMMVDHDRARSQQIRQQMSMFSNKVSEVDQQKRARDREALMAAAQRNVKARLQGMDQRASWNSGRVAPSVLNDWQAKAHTAAQARSEARIDPYNGKVDVGGGMFMDQEAVNEIAAKRIQPMLDDINQKAETERARLAEIKLQEDRKKTEEEKTKAREKETAEINKKLREQEKEEERAQKAEAKRQEQARKESEREAKAEQKRIAKGDKRKSRDGHNIAMTAGTAVVATIAGATAAISDAAARVTTTAGNEAVHSSNAVESPKSAEPEPSKHRGAIPFLHPKLQLKSKNEPGPQELKAGPSADAGDTSVVPPVTPAAEVSPVSPVGSDPTSPTTSPSNKVKTWIKRLSGKSIRRSSAPAGATEEDDSSKRRGFVGGVTLARMSDANQSTESVGGRSASAGVSMREVALAGRPTRQGSASGDERGERSGGEDRIGVSRASSTAGVSAAAEEVSSLSSDGEDEVGEEFQEARSEAWDDRSSGRPISFSGKTAEAISFGKLSGSPLRESRFAEDL